MVNSFIAGVLTAIVAAIIVISSFLEFYMYVIGLVGFVCLLIFLKRR
jgi:hypothetical protein